MASEMYHELPGGSAGCTHNSPEHVINEGE